MLLLKNRTGDVGEIGIVTLPRHHAKMRCKLCQSFWVIALIVSKMCIYVVEWLKQMDNLELWILFYLIFLCSLVELDLKVNRLLKIWSRGLSYFYLETEDKLQGKVRPRNSLRLKQKEKSIIPTLMHICWPFSQYWVGNFKVIISVIFSHMSYGLCFSWRTVFFFKKFYPAHILGCYVKKIIFEKVDAVVCTHQDTILWMGMNHSVLWLLP